MEGTDQKAHFIHHDFALVLVFLHQVIKFDERIRLALDIQLVRLALFFGAADYFVDPDLSKSICNHVP